MSHFLLLISRTAESNLAHEYADGKSSRQARSLNVISIKLLARNFVLDLLVTSPTQMFAILHFDTAPAAAICRCAYFDDQSYSSGTHFPKYFGGSFRASQRLATRRHFSAKHFVFPRSWTGALIRLTKKPPERLSFAAKSRQRTGTIS